MEGHPPKGAVPLLPVGVAPLWTPPKEKKKKEVCLWRHILQTSCQRGCAPLDTRFPAATASAHARSAP